MCMCVYVYVHVNQRVRFVLGGDHRVPKQILGQSMDEEPGAKGWGNHTETPGNRTAVMGEPAGGHGGSARPGCFEAFLINSENPYS